MKNTVKTILALSMLALIPQTIHAADTVAPKQGEVNHRLRHQNRRIKQGVKSGELTKSEAKDLRTQDKAVRTDEKAMRKDNGGTLTPADKAALNKQENGISKEIKEEKHDGAN